MGNSLLIDPAPSFDCLCNNLEKSVSYICDMTVKRIN